MKPLIFPDVTRGIASPCAQSIDPKLWHEVFASRYVNQWQASAFTEDLDPIIALWSPGTKSHLCYLGPLSEATPVLLSPPPRTIAGPAPAAPINHDEILKGIL